MIVSGDIDSDNGDAMGDSALEIILGKNNNKIS